MTFDAILDVSIGLVLVFALFSLLTSTIVELISAILRRRARMQEFGIYQLLDGTRVPRSIIGHYVSGNSYAAHLRKTHSGKDRTLANRFYELDVIRDLMDQDRLPTYVSQTAFVSAMMVLIHEDLGSDIDDYGAAARKFIQQHDDTQGRDKNPKTKLARLIQEFFPGKSVTREELEKRLRAYYKDSTDRIIGWYVRETQFWLVGIGLFIAIIFNVNTLTMTEELATNSTLRTQLAEAAANDEAIAELARQVATTEDGTSEDIKEYIRQKQDKIEEVEKKISGLNLPIGYCRSFETSAKNKTAKPEIPGFDPPAILPDPGVFATGTLISQPDKECSIGEQVKEAFDRPFSNLIGWVLTALAISLGAPFWFDLLSKLVAIRRVGKLSSGDDDKETAEKDGKEGKDSSPIINLGVVSPQPADSGAARRVEKNTFERNELSDDDIRKVQELIGAPEIDGDLTSENTRDAIQKWRTAQNGETNPSQHLDEEMMLKLYGRPPN